MLITGKKRLAFRPIDQQMGDFLLGGILYSGGEACPAHTNQTTFRKQPHQFLFGIRNFHKFFVIYTICVRQAAVFHSDFTSRLIYGSNCAGYRSMYMGT